MSHRSSGHNTPPQFIPYTAGDPLAEESHLRREKAKARELRQSQWWKNLRGRGVCYYCRRKVPARELTMDHVVPLIRGGTSSKSNLVPCCKDCNSRKKYLLPVEWQEYLDELARRSAQP